MRVPNSRAGRLRSISSGCDKRLTSHRRLPTSCPNWKVGSSISQAAINSSIASSNASHNSNSAPQRLSMNPRMPPTRERSRTENRRAADAVTKHGGDRPGRGDKTRRSSRTSRTLPAGARTKSDSHRVGTGSPARSGHQLLNRVEEQMGELEQRTTSAATELKHVTDVRAGLELEVIRLQNQLRPLTEAALSEVKKRTTNADETTMRLGAVRQEAERYQREETHRASAVIAGLETRMAEIGRTHRELDVAETHVEQLEQRAAAAAGEVRHATRAKDELQREIAKCQQQIERLTTAAQGEAEKLNGLRRHAEYHEADRASSPSAHDLLNTLRFRRRGPNTSRGFSPARLIFGGAAFALSAAIVLLVSIVWRISPVENQRPEKPLSAVVLASRALTLAPASAVAPPMPLTADISHDRPEATRPAPAVPAVACSAGRRLKNSGGNKRSRDRCRTGAVRQEGGNNASVRRHAPHRIRPSGRRRFCQSKVGRRHSGSAEGSAGRILRRAAGI